MKKIFTLFFILSVSALSAEAEVYLSKDEALKLVLGSDTIHEYDPKLVDDDIFRELKNNLLIKQRSQKFHFFKALKDGKITGYALIDGEVGKHLPITYIVGICPEGKVTRVEMMVFREIRGWEARERRFMRQFEKKGAQDEVKVGSNIRNVSGATLSSQAIARGVKRALYLWNIYYAG